MRGDFDERLVRKQSEKLLCSVVGELHVAIRSNRGVSGFKGSFDTGRFAPALVTECAFVGLSYPLRFCAHKEKFFCLGGWPPALGINGRDLAK